MANQTSWNLGMLLPYNPSSKRRSKKSPKSIKTVEDFIEILFYSMPFGGTLDSLAHDSWYANFVNSVFEQVYLGHSLTVNQANVSLKVMRRTKNELIAKNIVSKDEIEQQLKTPKYRNSLRPSVNIPKQVRYIGDGILAFRFKINETILADIKNIRKPKTHYLDTNDTVWFNHTHKLWLVRVNRDNMKKISEIILDHRFEIDDEATIDFLKQADENIGKKSTFVMDPESGKIVANVCDNELIAAWVRNVLPSEII